MNTSDPLKLAAEFVQPWRWLPAASLGLNVLMAQLLILLSTVTPVEFVAAYRPVFIAAWLLLSLGVGAAAIWAADRLSSWRYKVGADTWVFLTLAVGLAFAGSFNPDYRWGWLAGFQVSQYPLSGLELKALAGLLFVILPLVSDQATVSAASEDLGEAAPMKSAQKLGSAGVALTVVLLAAALPLLPEQLHVPIDRQVSSASAVSVSQNQADLAGKTYELPVAYGQIGPALVRAGAIDVGRLEKALRNAGHPLTEEQRRILTKGSDERIQVNRNNARFLLDLLWGFGLANRNDILSHGPMVEYSDGEVGGFASTGGWTLGTKGGAELFSSLDIVPLSASQQARVELVAAGVYRPCCNNPTTFPDCNHGMAMLGLLELMASQGATEDEMWRAAKDVSVLWFPAQMAEVSRVFEVAEGLTFEGIDGNRALGSGVFSAAGFSNVHAWLQTNGLLDGAPGSGASCGA